jgi:hypothetical protein
MASTSKDTLPQQPDSQADHRFPKGGDWRSRGFPITLNIESCAALKLPFEIIPEDRDYYPPEFTTNLRHLVALQEGVPWTGWYATYNGAKLAVSNMFGVWFEIERCEKSWVAIRLARLALKVQGHALPGIDTHVLLKTGEPTNEELIEEIK